MRLYDPNQQLSFEDQIKDVMAEVKRGDESILANIKGVKILITKNTTFDHAVYLYNKFNATQNLKIENFIKTY